MFIGDGKGGGKLGKPFSLGGLANVTAAAAAAAAVADSNADNVTVFLNNGQGYFFPTASTDVGSHPLGMVTGDFNGDGIADLAVLNSADRTVSIMLSNGKGRID